MYLCCLLPLRDILSYCYGAIYPICAKSAVKPQGNKQTNPQIGCQLEYFVSGVDWRG